MKALLLVLLFLFAGCNCTASLPVPPTPETTQTASSFTMKDFFGIAWGTPREELLKSTGAKLDEEGRAIAIVPFRGQAMVFIFEFQNGLLVRGIIITPVQNVNQCASLLAGFIEQHGEPDGAVDVEGEKVLVFSNDSTQALVGCPAESNFQLLVQQKDAPPGHDKFPAAQPDGVLEL